MLLLAVQNSPFGYVEIIDPQENVVNSSTPTATVVVSSDEDEKTPQEIKEIADARIPSTTVTDEVDRELFFKAGEMYDVDPYLIMAIAQLESQMGKRMPPNSYNLFGRICGYGHECVRARDVTTENHLSWIKFSSFEEAIFDEAKYLREKYLDQGLITIEAIGNKYAEDPLWASKIRTIMDKLKGE